MLVMFVVNLCPKAVQLDQEYMCWSQCLLTEQWCLLAHLHYMVGLYLTKHLCQHHFVGCYVQEMPELCLQRAWCRALDANLFAG